jgi:DNA-binding MarR family transcriptional regulator
LWGEWNTMADRQGEVEQEATECPPRRSPRHQLLFELAREVPTAQIGTLEAYSHFSQVARELFSDQGAFLGRYGLSEGKLVVLHLLHQAPHERLTPSALAAAAGVARGTMTGLLAGLERSGLVKRTIHPEDARMFTIELTESARELFARILPERVVRIMAFMSSLSADEQHQLRALLDKMERSLPTLSAS